MSNPVRVILCFYDTNQETYTFHERNFATQDPGPYDERTCAEYSNTPQATSKTGAELLLGQIISNGMVGLAMHGGGGTDG